MKRKTLRWIIGLMGFAMMGLIAFQLYWIDSLVAANEERFKKDVLDALNTVANKLEKQETFAAIESGNAPKGDVLATARLAGIMAAKQTATLIPLCHPLALQKIEVQITPQSQLPGYEIQATVKTKAETGVEMEALTAVSITALTLYDMAKALEKSIQIESIHLVSKSGGKSGDYSV